MTNIGTMMRGSALIVAFATMALIQGCAMPASGDGSASVYSGGDSAAALDAAMTADNGGE